MTTKNNWLTTSLSNRTKDNLCDFSITVNPYKFEVDTFKNNSIRVAKELSETYSNLYLLYSGGIDSEFVLKTFVDNKLPITPLIVSTPFNKNEISYAIRFLQMNNLKPYIINYTDSTAVLNRAKDICYSKGYYSFLSAFLLDTADIIADKNGKLISGEGELLDSRNNNNITFIEAEFYLHTHPANHIGGFFAYDIAFQHSMIDYVKLNLTDRKAKAFLYNLQSREKTYYTQEIYSFFNKEKLSINKTSITIEPEKYKLALTNSTSTTFT